MKQLLLCAKFCCNCFNRFWCSCEAELESNQSNDISSNNRQAKLIEIIAIIALFIHYIVFLNIYVICVPTHKISVTILLVVGTGGLAGSVVVVTFLFCCMGCCAKRNSDLESNNGTEGKPGGSSQPRGLDENKIESENKDQDDNKDEDKEGTLKKESKETKESNTVGERKVEAECYELEIYQSNNEENLDGSNDVVKSEDIESQESSLSSITL